MITVEFRSETLKRESHGSGIYEFPIKFIDEGLYARKEMYMTLDQADIFYDEEYDPEYVRLPGEKRFHRFWRQPGYIERNGVSYVMFHVK